MKELALVNYKDLYFNWVRHPQSSIADGSFRTIPNSLRQLPVKTLIIHEASSCRVEAKIEDQ
jgi:hypothetical protein